MGESPGLVIMGGDSCSIGCEFESRHCILDGHFSHLIVVKIVMFVWKDENKWKRGRGWPILKKTSNLRLKFTEYRLLLQPELRVLNVHFSEHKMKLNPSKLVIPGFFFFILVFWMQFSTTVDKIRRWLYSNRWYLVSAALPTAHSRLNFY